MNRILSLSIVLVIAGLISGCSTRQSGTPHTGRGAAPEPPVVGVVLRDFRFEPNPLKVTPGRVRFHLKNRGSVEHDFSIVGVTTHSEHDHKQHLVQPGRSRTIEVDLKPGAYEAICTVPGHKEAGMTVTVQAGSPNDH